MEKVTKNLFHKVVSFVLVAAMLFSTMVAVKPQAVSAADVSLGANGGTIAISDENCTGMTGELTYIRYKAKADGYLQLKFTSNSQLVSYAAGRVQLYNANKNKYLSGMLNYDTSSADASYTSEYYGVKKGTTYYIAVDSSGGGVKITAKFKKVTDKSGAKKSKALSLKKGKDTVGIIPAGNTKAHWFKFTTTKSQKLAFNITPYLTGPVALTLSGPGVYTRTFTIGTSIWGKKDPITTDGKVRAGTYYVQVKPSSKSCTGYYKVSWK